MKPLVPLESRVFCFKTEIDRFGKSCGSFGRLLLVIFESTKDKHKQKNGIYMVQPRHGSLPNW
jgi:hypothetical protein